MCNRYETELGKRNCMNRREKLMNVANLQETFTSILPSSKKRCGIGRLNKAPSSNHPKHLKTLLFFDKNKAETCSIQKNQDLSLHSSTLSTPTQTFPTSHSTSAQSTTLDPFNLSLNTKKLKVTPSLLANLKFSFSPKSYLQKILQNNFIKQNGEVLCKKNIFPQNFQNIWRSDRNDINIVEKFNNNKKMPKFFPTSNHIISVRNDYNKKEINFESDFGNHFKTNFSSNNLKNTFLYKNLNKIDGKGK